LFGYYMVDVATLAYHVVLTAPVPPGSAAGCLFRLRHFG
jgi:hypothetical protein